LKRDGNTKSRPKKRRGKWEKGHERIGKHAREETEYNLCWENSKAKRLHKSIVNLRGQGKGRITPGSPCSQKKNRVGGERGEGFKKASRPAFKGGEKTKDMRKPKIIEG